MGVIVGIIGVTACVLIGFIGPGGPLGVLVQPFELLVIGGSGVFTVITGNPGNVLKAIPKAIIGAIKGSGIDAGTYRDLLGLMASIFDTMRKEGVLGIEGDLNDPHNSPRFQKYPRASHDHHLMETFTGALRLFVDGVVNAFDLERLLDTEIETHHEEALIMPTQITRLADSFPALGIVAAVLGIIITMQHLDGPPTEIGHHVAAALVGTMLGILLSYGYVAPLANKMDHIVREQTAILKTVQAGLVSFAGGAPPQVALEFARKTIPSDMRPTAEELEEIIKEAKKT
ncbi:MAG: flagellar motor stator protein MotA [Candidatus Dadabacteria bacterium]|nr:MAG: flagellar motor stator protein MotA [Candidatus Dadabacteria bacterium]